MPDLEAVVKGSKQSKIPLEIEDHGRFNYEQGAIAPVDPENQQFNFNAQLNNYDQSLHVHQAMSLPDVNVAERYEKLYPGFISEVMDARRREQRARLMREKRAQGFEAEVNILRMQQLHESATRGKELEHQRFNAAVAIMALISSIFAVVGIMCLWKGNYWSAGGLGLGMSYTFSKVVELLKESKV